MNLDMSKNMDERKSKIANVIMAWDGYSDIWEDFFNLMDKYWKDINMPIYFVDLKKDISIEKVKTIKCGESMSWSGRLRYVLNQIETKYVYLVIEDFFYCKKVDNIKFDNAVKCMEKYDIKYYRLVGYPHSRGNFNDIKGLKCINRRLESGINLQAAIWNREFLLEIIGDNDINAWEFEYNQTLRSRNSDKGLLEKCVADTTKIVKYRNEIIKGKHNLFSVMYFKIKGYDIDTTDRAIMSLGETICFYLRFYGYRVIPNRFKISARKILRKFGMKFIDDTQYVK